jgi:ElaB/YqjD/DUF883 family membrane-anchored ribosome-binding protein
MFLDKYENFGFGEIGEVALKEMGEAAAKDGAKVAAEDVAKTAVKEGEHAAIEAAAKDATENSTKNMLKNAAKDTGKYIVKNPLKSLAAGTVVAAGVEAGLSGKKFGDVLQKDVKGEMNIAAPAVAGAVDAGVKASKPLIGAGTDAFLKIMKSLFGKFAYYIEIGLITMIVLGVIYFIYENFYKNRGVIIERVQSKFKMNSLTK